MKASISPLRRRINLPKPVFVAFGPSRVPSHPALFMPTSTNRGIFPFYYSFPVQSHLPSKLPLNHYSTEPPQSNLSHPSPLSPHPSPPPPGFSRYIDTSDINFRCLFTPELMLLADVFRRHDHELRIAGGAVRDILKGIQPKDVDFATTATPAEMLIIFAEEGIRVVHERGAAHGTIMVRVNDSQNFEVTTARIHVQMNEETNERVTEGFKRKFTRDWELDAAQRDLTINAMTLGLDGSLYDFHGGESDLAHGRVRFVGSARDRIIEDPQRILRFFRFHGQLQVAEQLEVTGFEDVEAIHSMAPLLANVNGQRIWPEFRKILSFNSGATLMKAMWQAELFEPCGLPLVTAEKMDEFIATYPKLFSLRPEPVTILTMLCNQQTDIDHLCIRMRDVSKIEKGIMGFVLANLHTSLSMKLLKDIIIDGKASKVEVVDLLKIRSEVNLLLDFLDWEPPKMPVTSFDLMQRGFKGGEKVQQNLKYLKEKWKSSNFTLSKEQLLTYLNNDRRLSS